MSTPEGSQDPLAKLEADTDARFERSEKMLNDRIDKLEHQMEMAYNTLSKRIERLEYP